MASKAVVFDNEKAMAERVKQSITSSATAALHPKIKCDYVTLNLQVKGEFLDVVGYRPSDCTFIIIECKNKSTLREIGQAIGQILTYKNVLLDSGRECFYSFIGDLRNEQKLPEAEIPPPPRSKRFSARFYVAVSKGAITRNWHFLRRLRKNLTFKVGMWEVTTDRLKYLEPDADAIEVKW